MNILIGKDSTAVSYLIAKNKASEEAFDKESEKYKQGLKDGGEDDEGGGGGGESGDEPSGTIEITEEDITKPQEPYEEDPDIYDDPTGQEFPGDIFITTKELTIPDGNGNNVTGVFQLHIYVVDVYERQDSVSGNYNEVTQRIALRLYGNGIDQSTVLGVGRFTAGSGWKGSTAVKAADNKWYWTSAKLSKSTTGTGIVGKVYWKYIHGERSEAMYFPKPYSTALQNAAYVGNMPMI